MVFLRSASRLARPASSILSARAGPRLTSSLRQPNAFRTLTATASQQGKVLLVLYDVSPVPLYGTCDTANNVIGRYPR
jgi:formate dehydrogenase